MRTMLIYALIMLTIAPAATARPVQDGERWRTFAQRLEIGELISVRMRDGRQMRGYFLDVAGDAVRVRPKTRIPVAARDIPLGDIEFMQRRTEGRSPGAKVLMGVGIAGGAVLGLFLVALVQFVD